MVNSDIFGYVATSLNVLMLVPQVVRTLRTKHTKDLSFATLLIFFTACVLWTLYGVAKHAVPVIIANTIVGTMNLILIIIKLRYPEKTNE